MDIGDLGFESLNLSLRRSQFLVSISERGFAAMQPNNSGLPSLERSLQYVEFVEGREGVGALSNCGRSTQCKQLLWPALTIAECSESFLRVLRLDEARPHINMEVRHGPWAFCCFAAHCISSHDVVFQSICFSHVHYILLTCLAHSLHILIYPCISWYIPGKS